MKYYAQKSVKVGPRGTTEILYTHEVSENKHVLGEIMKDEIQRVKDACPMVV